MHPGKKHDLCPATLSGLRCPRCLWQRTHTTTRRWRRRHWPVCPRRGLRAETAVQLHPWSLQTGPALWWADSSATIKQLKGLKSTTVWVCASVKYTSFECLCLWNTHVLSVCEMHKFWVSVSVKYTSLEPLWLWNTQVLSVCVCEIHKFRASVSVKYTSFECLCLWNTQVLSVCVCEIYTSLDRLCLWNTQILSVSVNYTSFECVCVSVKINTQV